MKPHTTITPDVNDTAWEERRERRSYLYGASAALMLTLLAFAMVHWHVATSRVLIGATGGLAILQMVIHFRFFLHITLTRHREDLHLIAFTVLILLIMITGTVWIMGSLAARMGMSPTL